MSSESIGKRLIRLEKAVSLLIQMHQFDLIEQIQYSLVGDSLLPAATKLMAIQKELKDQEDVSS